MAENSRWIATSMEEVAEFFGVTPTLVRRDWKHQGMPGGKGSYPLDEIARWRAERLRDTSRVPEADDLKERQAKAKTEKEEITAKQKLLDYQKDAGEVINKKEAMAEIEEMFHRVRAQLEQLPQRLATTLPPENRAQLIADMRHMIHLTLREMEGWGE